MSLLPFWDTVFCSRVNFIFIFTFTFTFKSAVSATGYNDKNVCIFSIKYILHFVAIIKIIIDHFPSQLEPNGACSYFIKIAAIY